MRIIIQPHGVLKMNFREQNVFKIDYDPYLQSWFHSSWTVVTRSSSELLEDILLFDLCFKNWTYLQYDNDSSFSSISVCFQCSVSVQEFHLVWKCCILKTITTMKNNNNNNNNTLQATIKETFDILKQEFIFWWKCIFHI